MSSNFRDKRIAAVGSILGMNKISNLIINIAIAADLGQGAVAVNDQFAVRIGNIHSTPMKSLVLFISHG